MRPHSAYAACRRAHLEACRSGVVVIPYSLTVPYLLTVYRLHFQYAGTLAGLRQTTEPPPAEGSGLSRPSDG